MANRQRALRALPTREWFVDAGLTVHANPRWDSLWAGVSLKVTTWDCVTNNQAVREISEQVGQVLQFTGFERVSHVGAEVKDDIHEMSTAEVIHTIDFVTGQTRTSTPEHLDTTIRSCSGDEVSASAEFSRSRVHGVIPTRQLPGARSGLRSRPAGLSKIPAPTGTLRLTSERRRTPIANDLYAHRVMSKTQGMNRTSYPVGWIEYEF